MNDPLPPPPEAATESNVGRWIRECGFETYDALHRFSVQDPEAFLSQAVEKLGIRFSSPWRQVLDVSRGVEQPIWFPRAEINIADSVFRTKAGLPAIISRRENDLTLQTTSAAELELLSGRVANGLVSMGFEPGDAIAIDMPMTRECVAIYLGIVRAGMVVVSIADSFAAEEVAARLRIADARAMFTQDVIARGSKSLPLYTKVLESHPPIMIVVRRSTEPLDFRKQDVLFEDFLSPDLEFDNVSRTPEAPMNVLFSSGTTGKPKAIPWSHTTPLRCALDGYVHQDIQPGDVVAWPTNVGWMMGPWLIFAALINRATIALYEGAPQSASFARFVQDAGVTILGVVPSLVRAWRRDDATEGYDWSRIKLFSSTGEASNRDDMGWLMDRAGGRPVIEYCGGTEIGGAYVTSTRVEPNRPSLFSAKTIASDFVILDDGGVESDEGEAYLIVPALGHSTRLIGGDHHSVYFEGCPPGPGGQVLRRHGDRLRKVSGEGYRALGRADDTMNLGGIKVSAVELERTMNRVDGILETAAVAISPDGGGPSGLVVYAVAREPATVDVDSLKAALQSRIRKELNPLFKIQDLRLVRALPRTASNKIMRRRLRELHAQR